MPLHSTTQPFRIFSVDRRYGADNPYTLADLNNIVKNWNSYQRPGLPGWQQPQAVYLPKPDIGIGHGEEQLLLNQLLKLQDLPSAGEPSRLWVQGLDLYAELQNVPEPIALMCQRGQLKAPTVEIYPNYRGPYGREFGPVLKRISLVGSTPPRLKGLGKIPPFRSQEPAAHGRAAQQSVTVFSECYPMDIAEARSILAALGTDVPEGLPDAFVILVASRLKELAPAVGEASKDAATAATASGGNQAGGYPGMTPDQFAERAFANISERVANQIAAGNAPVLQRLSDLQKSFGKIAADTDRQELETFAESNRSKLFPYERDPANENYIVGRLMRLPKDVRAGEMKAISNRPAITAFGETMPGREDDGHDEPHGKRVGEGNGEMSADRKKYLMSLSPIGKGIANRAAAKAVAR